MAKPDPDAAPVTPDQDDARRAPAGTPQTPEEIRRGVLQQRRHIQELDGEDPLRGGVDD